MPFIFKTQPLNNPTPNSKNPVIQTAKVIVFHYTDEGKFPLLSSEELTDLKKKLDSELKNHPDLTFNGTFIDDSGRGFCDWDAPSAEAVNDVLKIVLGAPPIDGTVVVRQVL